MRLIFTDTDSSFRLNTYVQGHCKIVTTRSLVTGKPNLYSPKASGGEVTWTERREDPLRLRTSQRAIKQVNIEGTNLRTSQRAIKQEIESEVLRGLQEGIYR